MNFIVCSVNQLPCPENYQSLISFSDVVINAVSSIEPTEIAVAYAFGAGSVATWWGLGFVISAAIKALSKA